MAATDPHDIVSFATVKKQQKKYIVSISVEKKFHDNSKPQYTRPHIYLGNNLPITLSPTGKSG